MIIIVVSVNNKSIVFVHYLVPVEDPTLREMAEYMEVNR